MSVEIGNLPTRVDDAAILTDLYTRTLEIPVPAIAAVINSKTFGGPHYIMKTTDASVYTERMLKG